MPLQRKSKLMSTSVSRVGRIYFYCLINGCEVSFAFDGWKEKDKKFGYGYNYILYESKKEYEEEKEAEVEAEKEAEVEEYEILKRIREFFCCYLPGGISLKELRKINKKNRIG